MLRLYLDEDSMSRALLAALRAQGFDVLSTAEAGRRGRSAEDQLTFATNEERTLVTQNVADFAALHVRYGAEGDSHAGIVVLPRTRFMPGPHARALAHLSEQMTPDDMTNRIEFLSNWL